MTDHLATIMLAAGSGTRFSSNTPKPFHLLAGLELIGHILQTVLRLQPSECRLVIKKNHKARLDAVVATVASSNPSIAISFQERPLGTGHAVACALRDMQSADLPPSTDVLILPGDVPLITAETLEKFIGFHRKSEQDISVLGFHPQDPNCYGRLLTTEKGELLAIKESRDCSPKEREISFCNSGIMLAKAERFSPLLDRLDNDNVPQELYLTDVIALGRKDGLSCGVYCTSNNNELLGINTRSQLAQVEQIYQSKMRAHFMNEVGVTLDAPDSVYFYYDTQIERDTIVGPCVVFGKRVKIGKNCHIKAFSDIADASIDDYASIGPFARLRGHSKIEKHVRIGNFVEIKNSHIKAHSKASHLAYIGDADVGEHVNIGAGVVFANYDGKNKHRTTIIRESFIGSNATLVAPVVVGQYSFVAAGSTIVADVPEKTRAFARARQINKTILPFEGATPSENTTSPDVTPEGTAPFVRKSF